ncbi:MAG: ribosomal protein S18-alanine N-acetyltransferase [Halanaerobiales bacterium]|nr:ribosomal protein S18-alanine N-acetyltransferase [Halanaerobiales bacterium]
MQISLDVMKENDIQKVLKIEREAFSNPWNVKFFKEELRHNAFALYLKAQIEGEIIGYVGCWFKNHANEVHIVNLAVKKEFRRKGIGTYLIKEIIDMSKNLQTDFVTLEVRVTNKAAIKLYQELGFKKAGLTPHYYLDNDEDALLMKKEIRYNEG